MNKEELKDLQETAKRIRSLTIEEIGHLGVGHIGGAMSIVDILTLLYFRHMNVDPANPRKADRDILVLSKGHAGPALYATLAEKGFFPTSWLLTLNQGGTLLPSHCDRQKTPGIDMTTGSLGQGISAAVGYATGLQMDHAPQPSIASSATAKATKARYGKPRCSPRTENSATLLPSLTGTACR